MRIDLRRTAICCVATATVLLAGCSTTDRPSVTPESPKPGHRLAMSECEKTPREGRIDRRTDRLTYGNGAVRVAVRPGRGAAQCVEYARWGNANVQVPPDSLLFTFAGGSGTGAQLEFLAVDLTGGRLPDAPKVGKLDHPIAAKVGVAVDGTYYADPSCTLRLVAFHDARAAGTFSCDAAVAQTTNPFAPSDDVDVEAPTTTVTPTRTASISGSFDVTA